MKAMLFYRGAIDSFALVKPARHHARSCPPIAKPREADGPCVAGGSVTKNNFTMSSVVMAKF